MTANTKPPPSPASAVTSDELGWVLAVGCFGELQSAARSLRVDHSTLYRRLLALERRLGALLFERDRGRYRPTATGHLLMQAAERWRQQQGELAAALTASTARTDSPLRLTTTEDVATVLLPRCLQWLREREPRLRMEVLVDDRPLDLGRHDADAALRPTRRPPEGWVGLDLGRIEMAAYAAPTMQARSRRHRWIMRDPAHCPPADLAWMRAHVEASRIVATFSSFSALAASAQAGLGTAWLPRFVGDALPLLRDDTAPPAAGEPSRLWLLCHPRLRREARMKLLFEAARAMMRLP